MMPKGLGPQEQIDFAVAHLFNNWGLKVAAVRLTTYRQSLAVSIRGSVMLPCHWLTCY